MSDIERSTRPETRRRLLRCPKCAAEIETRATMCEYCGALVHHQRRGDTLAMEGLVCFYCGDPNRWSAEGTHCRGCGRPFATTCPGCGDGVALSRRLCAACGLSVEEFDVARARVAIERRREQHEAERFAIVFARWQAALGLLLMVAAFLVGRIESRARRPLMVFGGAMGLTALLPTVLTASIRRSRRLER